MARLSKNTTIVTKTAGTSGSDSSTLVYVEMPRDQAKIDAIKLGGYLPSKNGGHSVIPVSRDANNAEPGTIDKSFIPNHEHTISDFKDAVTLYGNQGDVSMDGLILGKVNASSKVIKANIPGVKDNLVPAPYIRFKVTDDTTNPVTGYWEISHDGNIFGPISSSNIVIDSFNEDGISDGMSITRDYPEGIEQNAERFVKIYVAKTKEMGGDPTYFEFPTINTDMDGFGFSVEYTNTGVVITNKTGEVQDVKVSIYYIGGSKDVKNTNIFSDMAGYVTILRHGKVHETNSITMKPIYQTLLVPDGDRSSSVFYCSVVEEVTSSSTTDYGDAELEINDGKNAVTVKKFGTIMAGTKKITSFEFDTSSFDYKNYWTLTYKAHVSSSIAKYRLHKIAIRSKPINGFFTDLLTTRVDDTRIDQSLVDCMTGTKFNDNSKSLSFSTVESTGTITFCGMPALVTGDMVQVNAAVSILGSSGTSSEGTMEIQAILHNNTGSNTSSATSETVTVDGSVNNGNDVVKLRVPIPEITNNIFRLELRIKSDGTHGARVNAYSAFLEL